MSTPTIGPYVGVLIHRAYEDMIGVVIEATVKFQKAGEYPHYEQGIESLRAHIAGYIANEKFLDEIIGDASRISWNREHAVLEECPEGLICVMWSNRNLRTPADYKIPGNEFFARNHQNAIRAVLEKLSRMHIPYDLYHIDPGLRDENDKPYKRVSCRDVKKKKKNS